MGMKAKRKKRICFCFINLQWTLSFYRLSVNSRKSLKILHDSERFWTNSLKGSKAFLGRGNYSYRYFLLGRSQGCLMVHFSCSSFLSCFPLHSLLFSPCLFSSSLFPPCFSWLLMVCCMPGILLSLERTGSQRCGGEARRATALPLMSW